MKTKHFLSAALIIFFSIRLVNALEDYAIGADLSFLKMSEDTGFEFKENRATNEKIDISKFFANYNE